MVWSPTVATACLGLGVSALWATHAAAKKADKNKRVANLKWLIVTEKYICKDASSLHENVVNEGFKPQMANGFWGGLSGWQWAGWPSANCYNRMQQGRVPHPV
jgi:hypothetical protein